MPPGLGSLRSVCHGCIYEEGEQRRARRGTRREGRPLGTESAAWMEVAFAGRAEGGSMQGEDGAECETQSDLKFCPWDFLGGPRVKTLPLQCRGSIPG